MSEAEERDSRFQALAESIAIEAELRDSQVIRSLMKALRDDSEQAMRDLCYISPNDSTQIAHHMVKVRAFAYIREVLDIIMRRGEIAEDSIRAEDAILDEY